MPNKSHALLAALAIGFAACGGGEQQQAEAAPETPAAAAQPAAAPAGELPAGVTPAMVEEGQASIGAGIYTCGQNALESPVRRLGDAEWLHSVDRTTPSWRRSEGRCRQ
jgi:hypothetical protein